MKKFLFSIIFLAIIACFLWAAAFVGIRLGLKYITPLNLADFRFIITGLMIIPFTGSFSGYLKLDYLT